MFVNNATLVIFDNFEMTGLCQDVASSSSNGYGYGRDKYITDNGNGASATQNQYSNNYIHGWTHVAFSCSEPSGEPVGICYSISAFTGTGNTMSTLGPQNVCDGWDSDPSGGGCIQSMTGYNIYENVFAHQSQIETGGCHSIHDNLWQYFYPTGDGEAHGNQLECNTDFPQTDNSGHPQTGASINVFYNNILGHNAPGNATNGDVKVWFCVTTIPEYWFNNLLYDQGTANYWDIDTHDYNCSTSGVQYMFNNTFDVPGAGAINNVASLVATGNHTIVDGGSAFASGTGTISNTISMTHATAVTQGYMANGTGTSGNNNNVTCANDITPCAPTASLNSTVGAGTNLYNSYCTTLAGSSDPVIALAGTACKSATTEACSYNTSTRSVSCPGATVNARPTGGNGAWDAGINEYNSSNPPPNPPTGLAAVVN